MHQAVISRRGYANIALAGSFFLASLVVAELVLRALGLPRQGFFVLVPGTDWTIHPAPAVISGVTGVAHYRVNSVGIRGREFGNDRAEYRMLAVGGSTTECAQLDSGEVWTDLVDRSLDTSRDGRDVWVGNVGRSGLTTREHVLHLKYLLPQYSQVDAVVAMVGLNDMLSALHTGWGYRLPAPVTERPAEELEMGRAFQLMPDLGTGGPWYKTTALWRLARRARRGWEARRTYDLGARGAPGLVHARLQRRNARVMVDSLPPLELPLLEFRRNLDAMIEQARSNRVRLVLVSAPSIWRARMSENEQQRLWFGWIGPDWSRSTSYFTTGALSRAMAIYNGALLDACRDGGVECVDAASLVPRDTTMFYDDVHFTEAGSARLADILVAYFKRQGL